MSLFAGTGIIVKLVLLVLIYFSVVSWAIIFYKFIQVRKANQESERFLVFFWQTKRFDAVSAQIDRFANSPLSILFTEGYNELKKLGQKVEETNDPNVITADLGGVDNIARALRRATTSEITRLEKYLAFLATTGSTAPFIGLFGTVWGIMNSFFQIGSQQNSSLAVVAPGISEALFATAIGLFAAIPAVIAYNRYSQQVNAFDARLQRFSGRYLARLSRELERA